MARAYVYTRHGGPENETFLELDKPVPGPGELLVAVRAAGVNPADWKRRSGARGARTPLERPAGLGREVAGVVESVGENVDGFAPGDEVLGQVADGPGGGFATHALLAAVWTARKPAEMSFVDAAALPIAAATAYDAVSQLALRRGDIVLVIGAGGGVGIAACQFARNRGAEVIGTASLTKRQLVESMGAAHVASGDGAAERVLDLAPDGVDALFDLVGGEALRALAHLVKQPSRIVTAADEATASELGGARVARERTRAVLEAIVEMVGAGTFTPVVTEVLPLEKAGEALRLVESGHATGKVVLAVS